MTDLKIITEMTTAEMVAEYNKLTGKSIKKFSDRKAGERQLAAARSMAETKSVFAGKPSQQPINAHKKAAKVKKPATDRSTATAASWANKSIAAARATRTNVSVGGTIYRSVKEAFEKLGLPLGKHIKFRMELKDEATKTFEHDGKKYNFKVVEQATI